MDVCPDRTVMLASRTPSRPPDLEHVLLDIAIERTTTKDP